jgi:DNA repair protein RadC
MSTQRIHDLPEDARPRERLLRLGAAALSDAELVGIFINTGLPGENAVQVAQRLLIEQKGLRGLSRCPPPTLKKMKGLGAAKAAILAAAFELGHRVSRETLREEPLTDPELIYQLMHQDFQSLQHEEMHVILLNIRDCYIRTERVFKGGLSHTAASVKDVLRCVLLHGAHSFIVVHNHPSGDPTSSEQDRRFTRELREASTLLGTTFFDHIIIGYPAEDRPSPYFSFRAASLIHDV